MRKKTKQIFTIVGILLVLTLLLVISSGGLSNTLSILSKPFATFGDVGDMSIMSISKVNINGQEYFRVTATVSRGGEQLDINWDSTELTNALKAGGYSNYTATKSVIGSLSYDEQSLFFPFNPTTDVVKKLRWVDKGIFGTCNTNTCLGDLANGEELLWAGRSGGILTHACVCLIAKEKATYGQFGGSSIGNYQVTFAIDGLGSAVTNRNTRSAAISDKATIKWVGNLDSLDSLSAPRYDLGLFGSNLYMLNQGTDSYINTEYKKSCGVWDIFLNDISNCRYYVPGWVDTPTEIYNYFVDNYNTFVDGKFVNRYNEYISTSSDAQFIDTASLSSSGLTVYTKNPTSYPTFTIDLKATAVGIIKLSGKPQVICPSSCNFNSNTIGNSVLQIKNIGGSLGYFGLAFENCNKISGYIPGGTLPGIQPGQTYNANINLNGDTTNTNGEVGTCNIKVYDINNPSSSASCGLTCTINYNPGGTCSPEGKTKCDDTFTKLMICKDGSYIPSKDCSPIKCKYNDAGEAYCGGTNITANCKSCGQWFTNLFKKTDKCKATATTEFSILNPVSWLNWTGITSQNILCPIFLVIIVLIFIFALLNGFNIFSSFKAINDKTWLVWVLSLAVATLISWMAYSAFIIGIVLLIIFLIFKALVSGTIGKVVSAGRALRR